jgi:pyruvate dehydrogenase (quinone)
MLMGEVATLVKYNMNVKVIIIKNNVLGQIKWEQIVFEGNPEFGIQLQPIDFAGYAMNCGAAGFTINRPEEAESVLRDALAHSGPAVIQAVVDPNEPPMPGQVTTEQAIKFAKALLKGQNEGGKILKTILEDKFREVV